MTREDKLMNRKRKKSSHFQPLAIHIQDSCTSEACREDFFLDMIFSDSGPDIRSRVRRAAGRDHIQQEDELCE